MKGFRLDRLYDNFSAVMHQGREQLTKLLLVLTKTNGNKFTVFILSFPLLLFIIFISGYDVSFTELWDFNGRRFQFQTVIYGASKGRMPNVRSIVSFYSYFRKSLETNFC